MIEPAVYPATAQEGLILIIKISRFLNRDRPTPRMTAHPSPNSQVVTAHVPANVWQIVVEKGAEVKMGDRLVVLESMKMEMAIVSPVAGTVIKVLCTQGQMVAAGQTLLVIQL